MSRFFKTAAGLAVAAVFGVAGSAKATPVIPVQLHSGDVVDGWKISFPTGISLDNDGGPKCDLVLEKFAAFDSLEGLDITFTQVSYGASQTITLADEGLTNVSGQDWSGFLFLLNNTLPGDGGDAKFTSSFNLNDPADNKFTSQNISADTIFFHGNLPDTDTADLGFGVNGGQVTIDANPSRMCLKKVLDFKEIPVVAVPVPAAAWTGLSGLMGLGLVGGLKKVKKVLA